MAAHKEKRPGTPGGRAIPGTFLPGGAQARKGYGLNKMCYSFNSAENRAAFLRDEEAYCRRFGLDARQRAAVRRRDVPALIAAGGNIYYLAKFVRLLGFDMRDRGAQQAGPGKAAPRVRLVAGKP